MSIAEKVATIAQNQQRVYDSGYEKGYETGKSEGGSSGGSNKLAQLANKSITEVTAEDLTGATKIEQYMFYNCKKLKTVTTPDSVTSLGTNAFQYCTNLTNIIISDSVTSIAPYTFSKCSSLTSINTPNSLKSIGSYAFNSCSGLTSITIHDKLTDISSYAFEGCNGLNGVYITDIVAWCKISMYSEASNPLYYAKNLYLNEELVINLIIPDNVTNISACVFAGCTSLMSITIPSSITKINAKTFYNCASMQYYDFTSHTAVPTLANVSAFQNIPSTCEIRVPMALVDEWKSATNWSTYADNIIGV